MLVSAIVPVFNEEKAVGEVIATLLRSNQFAEIICINDGSSDNSRKILESYGKKIKLINFKNNKGWPDRRRNCRQACRNY